MAVTDALFAVWLISVNFCSKFADANLSIRPADTEVLVNHSTYFNCSTSVRNISANYVLWYHYPLNSAIRNDVYDEGEITYEYKDRFEMESSLSTGSFNLVVVSVRVEDAGRYECQDSLGHGDKASAELTVLDGNPICASKMSGDGIIGENSCDLEPDKLQLTCHVTSSHGNILPSLEWKISGDQSSSSLTVCEHSASCNMTLKGDRISNGQSFVCQTTKSTGEQYGCFSDPVRIKYVDVTKLTAEITTEGNVKCSANSSQPCTYKWYSAKDEEISQNEMLGTKVPGEYKCEAQCDMNRRNEICRFIAMDFSVVSPDEAMELWWVIVLSVIFICVIIGTTGLILWKTKFLRKQNTKRVEDPVAVDVFLLPSKSRDEESQKEATSLLTITEQVEHLGSVLAEESQKEATSLLTITEQVEHLGSVLAEESQKEATSLLTITEQDVAESSFGKFTDGKCLIDRGGSGAVYGPYRWKGKKCALKRILFSPDKLTEETRATFNEQINLCKDLNHPHLVKVFEMWFPSPTLYILMEYVEGKSLDKILRPKDASGPLEPFLFKVVANWALQIAYGMKYLHDKDIIHRNLKAAHVLVIESYVRPNTLKIFSYTLIKEHDNTTVMSVAWMAPEYFRDEPFSKLSDVWSYGVTVWEIVTRDVPHKEVKKNTDLVKAARNKTLKLDIPDSCPPVLRTLLTMCWKHKVKGRSSFDEICEFLFEMLIPLSSENRSAPVRLVRQKQI